MEILLKFGILISTGVTASAPKDNENSIFLVEILAVVL